MPIFVPAVNSRRRVSRSREQPRCHVLSPYRDLDCGAKTECTFAKADPSHASGTRQVRFVFGAGGTAGEAGMSHRDSSVRPPSGTPASPDSPGGGERSRAETPQGVEHAFKRRKSFSKLTCV